MGLLLRNNRELLWGWAHIGGVLASFGRHSKSYSQTRNTRQYGPTPEEFSEVTLKPELGLVHFETIQDKKCAKGPPLDCGFLSKGSHAWARGTSHQSKRNFLFLVSVEPRKLSD